MSTPARRPLAYRRTSVGDPGISARSADALECLRLLGVSDTDIHAAVSAFPGWNMLRAATPPELTAAVGHAFASLPLPETVPAPPALPEGTRAYTRYQLDCPAGLRSLPAPPVLVHVRGQLPERTITISGTDHASPAGCEAAAAAARLAGAAGAGVCAVATSTIGAIALRAAVEARRPALAIIPFGIDVPTQHALLLDDVLAAGGAILSFRPSKEAASQRTDIQATWVASALSRVIVIAEAGLDDADGALSIRAAIALSRRLIVPVSAHVLEDGGFIPQTAEGSYLLARAGSDVAAVFGSAAHLDERLAKLQPGADWAPSSPAEMSEAINEALAPLG